MAAGSHTKCDLLDWDHAGNINSKYSRKFGFTHIEYDKMLRLQGYKCACCGGESAYATGSLKFHVDHCHKTGKIRGLICKTCNQALGMCGDSIEGLMKLVEYLRSSEQRPDIRDVPEEQIPPRRRQPIKVKVWMNPRLGKYDLQYVHPKTLKRFHRSTGTSDETEANQMARKMERILASGNKRSLMNWLDSSVRQKRERAQICAEPCEP